MSTRGSFILRKNREAKELYIPSDAYPDYGGRGIVRMVKSLDLGALYDLLEADDYEGTYEGQDFSLEQCEETVASGKKYLYRRMGGWFIQDSLMCEYGYELDLDEEKLLFYAGFQHKPQEGNRYGTEESEGYYPCRLMGVFPFAYLRQNPDSSIVDQMEDLSEKGAGEVRYFEAEKVQAEKQGVRQLIIARKDLAMSPGKLAAQVSHASMAFLAQMLRMGEDGEVYDSDTGEVKAFRIRVEMSPEIYRDWLYGIFTKTICEARNKNHLLKAVTMAEEMGLREGKDFFLIRDSCLTELEPEEYDADGTGRTLTCIGFRPLPDETAHAISGKYQLYR